MKNREILQLHMKKSKFNKKMTMNDIAKKSKVGISTVNIVFADQDVKFSSITAILEVLYLNNDINSKVA